MTEEFNTLSDAEWRARLSPRAYAVLREGATEPAYSGDLLELDEDDQYRCGGCGTVLFNARAKFESHCGWPSFDTALGESVELRSDRSHAMVRTEVRCANCDGHLGHLFDDGSTATGQRYCINAAALAEDAS